MASLADIQVEVALLNPGPTDYIVITVDQPNLSREQAGQISDYLHRSWPQLAGRIIVKAANIQVESKTREEVVADDNVPPWLR